MDMMEVSLLESCVISVVSVVLTRGLNEWGSFSKIQSSAIASFGMMSVLGLNHYFWHYEVNEVVYGVLFYGATFIGMTSSQVAKGWMLWVSAGIYAVMFHGGKAFYASLGGKLGFIAGISVMMALGVAMVGRLLRRLWGGGMGRQGMSR